jgi:hypothetical protein
MDELEDVAFTLIILIAAAELAVGIVFWRLPKQ